ncbi:MAG TPA: tripartite tricarboxylate transporter substrate-binding protein, partial [Usitatibacter sp.]|nr:tripartite tricarboxylate transporter substrate-binding protein [Usitatibacter sp.]
GAKWAYVSFPGGGERLAALLGGHVDIMVIEPQEAGEQVRAGKLRVLAQLTETRLPGYPEVPTLKEAGFNFTPTPQIRGVVAPPQQSAEATAYWIDRFEKLRRTASWKKYVADNQLEEAFVPGPEFAKAMKDIEKELREQFQQAGIKTVR